jgi:hypothetical protein
MVDKVRSGRIGRAWKDRQRKEARRCILLAIPLAQKKHEMSDACY